MDELPPSNLDAERTVLGSILRYPESLMEVGLTLRPTDFYQDHHQQIYYAMLRCSDAGSPIDLVSVTEELRRAGQGVQPAYLVELWDCEPTGRNAGWHANLVKEASIRRQLVRTGQQIAADAQAGTGSAGELLENAERSVFGISDVGQEGQTVPLDLALNEACDRIDAIARGEKKAGGVPTGFVDLDDQTAGLHAAELTIIAARPSVGKSALAVSLARNVAVDHGIGVYLVSLEMSRLELANRLMCCQGRVNSKLLRRADMTPDEWTRLSEAKDVLRKVTIHIDDTPNQRMFRIAATARRLKLKYGIGLVIVDYLQLVQPENTRESRQEQVAGISRRLKLLARELGLPVVACAQLNRGSEDRKDQRPRLSDLRESGAIEQDSDNVLLLHKNEELAGVIDVIIAKQRNGPTGTIQLGFNGLCMRFVNHAPEPYRFATSLPPERYGAE